MPIIIHNYISKNNGSIFRIIPWYGYSLIGSFIATLFYWNQYKRYFKATIISSFVSIGLLLILYSSDILMHAFHIIKLDVFKDAANYNYLFSKLGYVLIYFAIFYSFEKYLKQPFILKIGKNTLSIYVVHFILLYGSFFDIGLKNIGKILSPIEAIVGALLFLTLTIFISFNYAKGTLLLKRCFNKWYGNSMKMLH